MEKIFLRGHDSSTKWLEEIEDGKYKLCGDLVEYSRYGLDCNNDYYFADPPGGPMLFVGDFISGSDKRLTKIENTKEGLIFTLEDY